MKFEAQDELHFSMLREAQVPIENWLRYCTHRWAIDRRRPKAHDDPAVRLADYVTASVALALY